MKPIITKEKVKPLFETKFLNVFDLEYEEGKHYFNASRRKMDDLMAIKSDEEFKVAAPDAVTCVVILDLQPQRDSLAKDSSSQDYPAEPVLLLSKEYRYPAGQFLLSPPAGLIDSADLNSSVGLIDSSDTVSCSHVNASTQLENALFSAAKREIFEETGITLKDSDTLKVINPLLFSTPGMTDESNALVLAVAHLDSLESLTQEGAEGSECFDGFCLLTKSAALDILNKGCDMDGIFYSVYTWSALMYFVSDMWR